MLVRSQNKKIFMEVKILEVFGKTIQGYTNVCADINKEDWVGAFKLGEYESQEAAIKVLDTMLDRVGFTENNIIFQLPTIEKWKEMEAV